MQSTVLDNLPETDLSTPTNPGVEENASGNNKKQSNLSDMQLIPQKSLKENANANNSITPCHSEAIVSENRQPPSELCVMSENTVISGADAYPETDAGGKTDDEVNELTPFERSRECDSLNLPDASAANPMARHASMTSVASSRTSRESGYFSSSSSNESPQLQLPSNGIEISIDEEGNEQVEDHGGNSPKQIESVPEENDEDLRRSIEDLDQSSTIQCNDESLNDEKLLEDSLSNQNEFDKEHRVNENHCETQDRKQVPKRHNRVSVKDINKKLGEIDHLAPTASMAMDASFQLTYVDRVILELIETERMYVRALEDILAGYDLAIKNTPGLPIKANDAKKLFGNIKDIYAFNRKFLSYLENCESDPVRVGHQFVSQDTSFSVYTEYCTNYPISVSILTRCMKNPVLAQFFKSQQESLRHTLPLGAYLLKPVQRILKYRLILQEMVKNCDHNLENFSILKQALTTMTYIARHINEMKRKNEDAVHIQELQSLLTNWPGNDLTTYGNIVMEGDLKLQGARNERLIFLFDKMILISKRREDGFIIYKTHIKCSDLILLESVKENPMSFLIAPFDHPVSTNQQNSRAGNKQYILTVKYPEEKKLWTQNIKKQILINHHTAIPLQAQQSIMNMDKMKMGGLSSKKNKRAPPKLFGTTLAPSTLDSNGKIRRRNDSINRKTLPIRSSKKKQENDVQKNTAVEATPEQNTTTPSKSRFSIPWINKGSSPKHEPSSNSNSTSADQATSETFARDEEKKEDIEQEEKYQAKKFVKKRGRNAMRKNGRHKESVIYKRYKRRQSQPVFTELEQMMKKKDPESPKPEARVEKKSNSDLSIDDFESFEDFLCCTVNNSRDSVSWDVQIVEAVFERFNKEKENELEIENNSIEEKENASPTIVPTIEKLKDSSDVSEAEDSHKSAEYDSNETLISESIEELTPTEELVSFDENVCSQAPQASPRNSFGEISKEEDEDEDLVLSIDAVENQMPNEDALWSEELFEAPTSIVDTNEIADVVQIDEETDDDDDDVTKNDVNEIPYPESPSATVKRSLSTQSTYTDHRRYFEKLKEIRDRRHSNVSLNSYDANQIIQTGTVKEMIAHHRDYVASRVQGSTSYRHSQLAISEITAGVLEKAKSCADAQAPPPRNRHRRRQRSSATSESSQCEDLSRSSQQNSIEMDPVQNSCFSTMTTGSLPLNFTSSSNSSSTSSINDAEDNPPDCTSSRTPKYKVLLQPRLFLWRSYFEDNGANTRRGRNLAIQTTSETKPGREQKLDLQHQPQNEAPHKIPLLKEVAKITTTEENKKDELSKDSDNVWEDFKTKAKKFESLCRSSSSEKVHERQPLKRSSFRTWKDLAAASGNKETSANTSFKQIQEKWKKELLSDTTRNHAIKTTRLRFNSNRDSISEADSSTTPRSDIAVKRSSSYRSTTTNKTTASVATTPLRFNAHVSDSTSDITATVKRSSSYKNKQPVSLPFACPHPPVTPSISRHNSMTNIGCSSPVSGAPCEDIKLNLSRSGSYRGSKEPVRVPSFSSINPPLRRRSSRSSKVNSSNADNSTTKSSNVDSSTSEKSAVEVKHKDEKTISASIEKILSTEEEVDFKIFDVNLTEKERMAEVVEQCSGKSVLTLAQRFDHIAIASGNSNLLTGRNRLNKARKHHSDLALPTSSETSGPQNAFAAAKKHQLKRHQSCVITKTWQNRELPLTRRLSEAQFSGQKIHTAHSTSSLASEDSVTKQSQFSSTLLSDKPMSPPTRNARITRAQSEEVFISEPPPPTSATNRQPPKVERAFAHDSDPIMPLPSKNADLSQTISKSEGKTITPAVPPTKTRTRTRRSNVSESSNSDANPVSPLPVNSNPEPLVQLVSNSAPISGRENPKSPTSKPTGATEAATKNDVHEPQPHTSTKTDFSKSVKRIRTRVRNRKTAESDSCSVLTSNTESQNMNNSRIFASETIDTTALTSTNRSRTRGTRSRRKQHPTSPLEITPQNASVSSKSNKIAPSVTNEICSESTSITSTARTNSHNPFLNNKCQNVSVPGSPTRSKPNNSVTQSKDVAHEHSNNKELSFSHTQSNSLAREVRESSELGNRPFSFVQSLCKTVDSAVSEADETAPETKFERPPTPIFKAPETKTNSKTSKNPPSDFIALFCKI